MDVQSLANLKHLKAHSKESDTLRTLGWVYRLTDKVCSHQSPEISRETLAHFASPTEEKGHKGCVQVAVLSF